MSQDIVNKLDLLNPQELAKVAKLVNKLAAKHVDEPKSKPVESRPVKKAKPPQPEVQQIKQRPALRDVVRSGGNSRPAQRGGESTRTNVRTRSGSIQMGKGTKLAQKKEFETGPRENQFLEMLKTDKSLEANKARDRKIDKLIDRPDPTPRMPKRHEEWVECDGGCNNEYLVDVGLCTKDDNGNLHFRCNSCIVGNKR